jgi:hypothetical protein
MDGCLQGVLNMESYSVAPPGRRGRFTLASQQHRSIDRLT